MEQENMLAVNKGKQLPYDPLPYTTCTIIHSLANKSTTISTRLYILEAVITVGVQSSFFPLQGTIVQYGEVNQRLTQVITRSLED